MIPVLQSLAIGAAVGALFGLFRAAPPVPATWAGLAGIVGIFLGWALITAFRS